MEWGWQESGWAGVLVLQGRNEGERTAIIYKRLPIIQEGGRAKMGPGGAAKEEKDARRRGTACLVCLVPRTSLLLVQDYFSSSCILGRHSSLPCDRQQRSNAATQQRSNKQTVAHSHSAPVSHTPSAVTAISYRSSLPWRGRSG
jgi:hypothetical protein